MHATSRNAVAALASAALLLAGCSTPGAETAPLASNPSTAPVKTITSFSQSLSCMDELLATWEIPPITLTNQPIGDLRVGLQVAIGEMLVTALNQMGARSQVIEYFDPVLLINPEFGGARPTMPIQNVPDFYIRGALTQFDGGVLNNGRGFTASYEDRAGSTQAAAVVGPQSSASHSVIALDLNIARSADGLILPETVAKNSIVLSSYAHDNALNAALFKFGVTYGLDLNDSSLRQEGLHQAIRTLVELSAVEMIGKLTRVPYWRCLEVENTNPVVQEQVGSWYAGMSEGERTSFVQAALVREGYLGEASGALDGDTETAIARFQSDRGLIPSGRIDRQLYAELLGDAPRAAAPREREPVSLTLRTRRPAGPLAQGEKLSFEVAVSRNAYVYCYYQDETGDIVQVFPNPAQRKSYVSSARPLVVPSADATFAIQYESSPQAPAALCVASDRDPGRHLPQELRRYNLDPIRGRTLDALVAELQSIDRSGLATAQLAISTQ